MQKVFFFYPPFCCFPLFPKCIFINKYFPFSTSWLTEEGEGDLGAGRGGRVTTLHVKETVKMKSTKEHILCRKRGKCVTKYNFPIFASRLRKPCISLPHIHSTQSSSHICKDLQKLKKKKKRKGKKTSDALLMVQFI